MYAGAHVQSHSYKRLEEL